MSSPDFDRITAILDAVAYRPDQLPDDYLTLLARVMSNVQDRQRAVQLAKFGTQFKPAAESVDEKAQERLFQPMQQVFTSEGYLGYVVGHDKRGHAIVNIVWEAAEYPESKLTMIPGPSVLNSMKT